MIIITGHLIKQLVSNVYLSLDIPLVDVEIRTFADGEIKKKKKNHFANKTYIVFHSIVPPTIITNIMQMLMMIKI